MRDMERAFLFVVATLALPAAGCNPDGPDFLPGDGTTDTWVPDGTGPCTSYTDADGDTISDSIEGGGDWDGDTIPNNQDLDSDNDTVPDAEEAGDSDLCTPPVNTDWGFDSSGNPTGDENPDFLDLDSDNDGIKDADEVGVYGTDPTNPDTDGDGVTDLGEVAAGTDPVDATSTISPDDYFVILPYMAPDHEHRSLAFGTTLQVADVYFLIDTTGSMDAAITNVATSLSGTIVPALRDTIPDVQMGVGHFNDMPYGGIMGYGDAMDMPFWHNLSITGSDPAVQGALDALYTSATWGSGADNPESHVVALYLTATGSGFDSCNAVIGPQSCPEYPDEISPRRGYPCFRPDALPVVVMVSDAPWHNGPTGEYLYDCTSINYGNALYELLGLGARVVGVFVDNFGTEGLAAMQTMAAATGAVDAMGNALVDEAPSGSVSTGIVDMIATLATATPQDVNAVPRDEPGDPPAGEYDATVFVKGITPVSGFPDAPIGFSGMDADYFFDVVPGTTVTFDIDFYNNTVEPTDSALVFKAWIVVLGNGVAMLDQRMVIIIVPTEGMGDIMI